MIAMTDDDWQSAKMAIGRFASPEIGEYWGVNTEVLGGKIEVGADLLIERISDTPATKFHVRVHPATASMIEWVSYATETEDI